MSLLFLTHERFLDHEPGRGHPERPERLQAVLDGIDQADIGGAVVRTAPRPAEPHEVELVHDPALIELVRASSAGGGGWLDGDTATSEHSYEAAMLAVGAGLTALEALEAGGADGAFCAVRPPGHHATVTAPMGFCLFNNVAVTAAVLSERGERVLIVDYDAHHGNGTQDVFWTDPRVAYVSFHEYPLYPGTGALRDVGAGPGRGTTLNLPLPAGATGDAYREGVENVVRPFAEAFQPTWLLLSAGFDAHRADPITHLGLSSGDFADITADLLELAPRGRRIAFLEGGYDLEALRACAGACAAAMVGERRHAEQPTAGGPGREAVAAAGLVQAQLAELG